MNQRRRTRRPLPLRARLVLAPSVRSTSLTARRADGTLCPSPTFLTRPGPSRHLSPEVPDRITLTVLDSAIRVGSVLVLAVLASHSRRRQAKSRRSGFRPRWRGPAIRVGGPCVLQRSASLDEEVCQRHPARNGSSGRGTTPFAGCLAARARTRASLPAWRLGRWQSPPDRR